MMTQALFRSKRHFSLLFIAVIFFIVLTLLFLFWFRGQVRDYIYRDIDRQLLTVAESVPLILPENYHMRARTPHSISSAEYRSIEQKLNRLALKSGAKYIWTDILINGRVFLTSCNSNADPTTADTEIYYFMPYKNGVSEPEMKAFKGSSPVYGTFRDAWGHFRAVFVPVKNPDGSVYLACAEFTVDYVDAMIAKSNILFMAGLAAFLLGISPLCFFYIAGSRRHRRQLQSKNNQLIQSRNRMETTLRSIGDGVIVTDSHGLVFKMNPAAQSLTGWKMPDAEGMPHDSVLKFVSTDNPASILNPVEEVITSGRAVSTDRNISLITKDSRAIEVITSAAPVIWENSESISGVVLVIRDTTERNKIEERMNSAKKMEAIGVLASGIAHDFNNMLGGIMGAAELLKYHLPDDSEAQWIHKTIISSASRAAELTRQMLTFSRDSTGVSAAFNIHDIINETLFLVKSSIDPRIKIETDFSAVHSNILGDSSVMQNSFLNLCINASHAMPEGGTIRISTREICIDQWACEASPFDIKAGCFIEIDVSDTGIGIPKENLTRIFEPFFTTKEQGHGTGLGLASVYGAIKQHDGAISVYSEIGKGTVFQMLLPLTGEQVSPADMEEIKTGTGRILLADDDEIMRNTASAILEKLGYEVQMAENGQEALDIFTRDHEKIDLVILDMTMPVMNGMDCFEQIRSIDPHAPVIMTSGFSSDEDLALMKQMGLRAFISKPFLTAALSRTVHDIIHENKRDMDTERNSLNDIS